MKTFMNAKLSPGSLITRGSFVVAFLLVIVGYVVGMISHGWDAVLGYKVGSAWQAYAGLFILAAGIERLIQPFSDFLGDAPAAPPAAGAPALLANGSMIFTRIDANSKKNTAIVTWGLASGLGCLACALLGVGLLTAVMGTDSATPAPALDVLVSGLVVGAGTKPLHDLITNIQASKDVKQAQVPTA